MTLENENQALCEQDTLPFESAVDTPRDLAASLARSPNDQNEKRKRALAGTPQERAAFLKEDVFIKTPDVIAVTSAIDDLFRYKKEVPKYAAGFRVCAPGGMGKDTIMEYYNRKYPPKRTERRLVRPILHVSLESTAAPGTLLRTFLDQVDCYHTSRHSNKDLRDMLLDAMERCETKAIFINEAQHLVPVSHHRHESRLAGVAGDWFKTFVDKTSSLFILLGVPGWDAVFNADKQLGTRIPLRYEYREYALDRHFIGILAALDAAIPMPEPAELAKPPLAPAIHKACRGNWRNLSILLHDAIFIASKRGSPRIERKDLASAYRLKFSRDDNPFEQV